MKNIESEWLKNDAGRDERWYDERIDLLRGFVTDERAAVLERTLADRTRYMTVCMENTFHPQNASALVRHCEAFGIQDIHTIETRCKFNPNLNIVRGTDKWVDLKRHRSTADAMEYLRKTGYRIVATTPHRGDSTPETFDVTRGPFALVFGTEHAGISDEVMQAATEYVRIPMCGMVESLNVSASAAILIYILSLRMREQVAGWQLCEEERRRLHFRWLASSVRDAFGILRRHFDDTSLFETR